MNILQINKFFYLRGGAEASFFETSKILQERGHRVSFFSMDHPDNMNSPYSRYFVSAVDLENPKTMREKLKGAGRIIYSWESRNKLGELLEQGLPDLVHLHNIHHHISPSILHTLKKYDLPVVLTLHDYKPVCPVYTLLCRGQVCERCRKKRFYFCLLKKCCKDSLSKSALIMTEMYFHHHILKIYGSVDAFISPSRFMKHKLKELGFRGKIHHLPNPIGPEEFLPSYTWEKEFIVYFGRLSKEKGIFTLLRAMKDLPVQCKIFGEGPEKKELIKIAEDENISNVAFPGFISKEELKNALRKAMFAVVPSEWYENYPYSIIESFALGKPVIASKIGGIPELVEEAKTGLTFEPGNVEELKSKIMYFLNNPEQIVNFGKNARYFVERNLNPENYYQNLMTIYRKAIERRV
jgi:glycosyltransferase involved in cell wall biosynthesis